MRREKKNYFGLIIIALIAVIYGAYLFVSFQWTESKTVHAAITSGSETRGNVLSPTNMTRPVSAMDADGNTVIVWAMQDAGAADTSGMGVYYRRFDKNGVALDAGDVLVNSSTSGEQTNPAVAMDQDGNFIITWEGSGTILGQGDTSGVFLKAFQADGTAVGGEIRVNSTTADTQNTASIAMDYDGPGAANRFIVTWSSFSGANDFDLYFQRFDANFTQTAAAPSMVGSETTMFNTTDIQIPTSVAMNNLGEFAIVWSSTPAGGGSTDFFYVIMAQNGAIVEGSTQLNSEAVGSISAFPVVTTDKSPRSGLDDPNARTFIFVYGAKPFTPFNLFAIRVVCSDPNTSNGTDADLSCAQDGSKLIIYEGNNDVSEPRVSADYLGNFTAIWEQNGSDGSGYGVISQSFTYQGKKIGDNINVNTTTPNNQATGAIAMNTDGFYTISFFDVANRNVLFQNYITEIFKLQSQTLAHTASANSQAAVDTAVAPNGNVAFVWKDFTTNAIQLTLKQFNPSNSPPDYTTLVENVTISHGGNVDNAAVSFFRDESGTGVGRFIVAWESDISGNKDIYYKLFDASGTSGSAAAINSNGNIQVSPDVSAGYYNPGGTGSGPALAEFAVGWHDATTGSIESGYNSSGFTFKQLSACASCGSIAVDLDAATQKAVYAWDKDSGGNSEVFIRQTTAGSTIGNEVQASPGGIVNGDASVAFVSGDRYVVAYTEIVSGSQSEVYGQTYEFGGGGPANGGTRFPLTQFPATTTTELSTSIAADAQHDRFLAVWGDAPTVSTDDFIFGQFFNFTGAGGTNVSRFGPSFRINSTTAGNQSLPSVDMNSSGQITVAWEGNYSDPLGTTDSSAAVYQLLQDPQNPQAVLELTPTAQQEIQAGGQFLDVPTTITFPEVALSATDATTQSVSLRDPTHGGDTKYIEIQDATGVDFTFSVRAGDFFSVADGKSYIKNDQHFRVKNWDDDLTDIDAGDCDNAINPTDPEMCFQTIESTVTPTAFTLNPGTQSFIFADSQVVLAEKQGTVNNEIGRWRIFPEFEITVPPLIPPGAHTSQITFTLT